MKPEEAIAHLKGMQNKKVDYAEMVCAPAFCSGYEYVYPEPEDYAIAEAIKALKEIQNYRKLGTLEELARAKRYIDLSKRHGTIGEMIDECAEYEEIGTVEECREAMEKQKPKKCIEDSCPDHTHYKCPSCGKIQKTKYDNSTFGCILNNCSNCGQALEMEVEDG